MTNFFEHQNRAKKNTLYLVFLFVLSIVLTIFVVSFFMIIGFIIGFEYNSSSDKLISYIISEFPTIMTSVAVFVIALFLIGCIIKLIKLSKGGEAIAKSFGAKEILRENASVNETILLNVIDEISLSSNIKSPRVFKTRDAKSINLFVAGANPQNAVICVTKGTIETLKRDELQNVIAHEYSHIFNGDMKLNMSLAVLLYGLDFLHISGIALFGFILKDDKKHSSSETNFIKEFFFRLLLPLLLAVLAICIAGYFGHKFTKKIKKVVVNEREFLADATAVQFTRDPNGLVSALKKIGFAGSSFNTKKAQEYDYFHFANQIKIEDRILRLEPNWDGKFTKVSFPEQQNYKKKK